MRISGEAKLVIGIFIATVVIIVVGIYFFSQPAPTFSREELLPTNTTTRGSKDAKVFLVEFSDFQCPACKTFKPLVDTLVEKYKDKLIFGFRHFPLDQHQYAQKAALASEAAGEQEKFWEMYNFLYENQNDLSDKQIDDGARLLGLDTIKFEYALKSEKYKDKIFKDLSDGKRFGVDATPTFFLNGKKLILIKQEDLSNAIKEAVGG